MFTPNTTMRAYAHISLMLFVATALAQDVDLPDFVIQEDDPVLYQLDMMDVNHVINALDPSPVLSDSAAFPSEDIIEARLAELDRMSPVDLSYNKIVSAYIKMYTQRKRKLSSIVLARSQEFYPLFEQMLDLKGLPLEIKHLAVVESALDPRARSRMGATGLWQFMLYTGKQYGLEVNSYIDERRDPKLSTEAAAVYLKYLHSLYDDWNLALAAYNCGPGNVNKAIRRSGGHRDYWKIYRWLPRETRGYVPAFIAVNYLMAFHGEHGIEAAETRYHAYELDTLKVCYALSFDRIEKFAGIDVDELSYLNPKYKLAYIPDPNEAVTITLPKKKIGAYIANEESICYFRTEDELEKSQTVDEPERIVHTVRRGQTLGSIANRHGVSVRGIMNSNGLRSTRIRPGQRLYIDKANQKKTTLAKKAPVAKPAEKKEAPAVKQASLDDITYFYRTIKTGDTLWDIANDYSGVSVDQIKRINQGMNFRRLNPGDKIRIPSS